MKDTCYICREKFHIKEGDYCSYCGQFICHYCSSEHESECSGLQHEPDTDIFGMCYSDADPGL